jgi:hypothetical protein
VSAICQKLSLAYFATLVVADADAALGRHADFLRPDVERLVVVDVDRRPQLFRRQPVHLGQELPRIADRVALEIVAEAEIAEHLEERVMPRRVADVVEVVVLAAGPHAALRGGRAPVGPLVEPDEHVLELDHPRIDEQERGVVARNERRRRHDHVPALFEIREEPVPDVGGFHGLANPVAARGDWRIADARCKAADFTRLCVVSPNARSGARERAAERGPFASLRNPRRAGFSAA